MNKKLKALRDQETKEVKLQKNTYKEMHPSRSSSEVFIESINLRVKLSAIVLLGIPNSV